MQTSEKVTPEMISRLESIIEDESMGCSQDEQNSKNPRLLKSPSMAVAISRLRGSDEPSTSVDRRKTREINHVRWGPYQRESRFDYEALNPFAKYRYQAFKSDDRARQEEPVASAGESTPLSQPRSNSISNVSGTSSIGSAGESDLLSGS